MFEKNQCFLNAGGRDFVNISYLSGTDSDGDGRGAIPTDFNNDGQVDLIVRQVSGGPLKLYENRFPARHYLKVSLDGVTCNKAAIGARVTATCRDQTVVRWLYPVSALASQEANVLHFGLGEAVTVDTLMIQWPDGTEQRLSDISADQHIRITQGQSDSVVIVPGQVCPPL